MRVAGLSAEPLIANRISGKIMGKIISARWRRVRVIERRATARICSNRSDRTPSAPPCSPGARALAPTPPPAQCACLHRLSFPVARALELATGLGQEHIVQRGLMELQQLDMQVCLV